MGKAWPGARKTDRLKAKRKERGGEVKSGRAARDAALEKLETARWISSLDAAAALGLSHPQVLVAITSGRLKSRRAGGKFLVESASVNDYRKTLDEKPTAS